MNIRNIIRDWLKIDQDIELLHKRIGDRVSVHADLHTSKPNEVIVIGKYRGHSYVRAFTVDTDNFYKLVEHLKVIEPFAKIGYFDMINNIPFETIYPESHL